MLRRLHHAQPESFEFTPANLAWAQGQITKYPEGRQASAVIPLLWRAQEQEGWLSRPAMEYVGDLLDMKYIRVLEVATFYFMFQLKPVGSVANIQICGTTSCMICGAEDLVSVCKELIADQPHTLSADGKFTWEEVECLGACANAPMAQIGKDYYEDLTAEKFRELLGELAAGRVPQPGPQNGRFASEPLSGLTSLTEGERTEEFNGSVGLANSIGDTVKRIDGTEVPLLTPWLNARVGGDVGASGAGGSAAAAKAAEKAAKEAAKAEKAAAKKAADEAKAAEKAAEKAAKKAAKDADIEANAKAAAEKAAEKAAVAGTAAGGAVAGSRADGKPVSTRKGKAPLTASDEAAAPSDEDRPETLTAARGGQADDLKLIKGVGPKLEGLLHTLGFFHFDQVASWSDREVAWVDHNLEGFKGRVSRDEWVAQAKILASGAETEFSARKKK